MHINIIVDNCNCNLSFVLGELESLWLQGTEIWRLLQPNNKTWWGIPKVHTEKAIDKASEQAQKDLRTK